MKNQVQLITYVDRICPGGLADLRALLTNGALQGLFGGVHLLPFFYPIDGADAGFDPIDHTAVDPQLGGWNDVKDLSGSVELMADLIVNHMSNESPQYQDFHQLGAKSRFAGLFLTFDSVFPKGATEVDLLGIYRPRPGLPFLATILASGERRLLWSTFTPKQIDINVHHPEGVAYLDSILGRFQEAGVNAIRLDAAGYAIKKPGTSCFMIPETYAFISELSAKAQALGIEVLVEIHSHYLEQVEIAKRVDRVYDFALPPLVLHALFTGQAGYLKQWLTISPRNAVTVLDTHDGIGVIDVGGDSAGRPGLLPPAEIDALVETIHERSGGQSRQATGAAASNLDLYQVNCTFYDALGQRDTEYLIARALQFFSPGIPQIYYVGLFAGENDMGLLERCKVGRDINRHYYNAKEIELAVHKPVVQKLFELIRFRNIHGAFNGAFEVESSAPGLLMLAWRNVGHWATLDVDFTKFTAVIRYSESNGGKTLTLEI